MGVFESLWRFLQDTQYTILWLTNTILMPLENRGNSIIVSRAEVIRLIKLGQSFVTAYNTNGIYYQGIEWVL
jgi:hypothetical protein